MASGEPIGVGKIVSGTFNTLFARFWGFALIGLVGSILITVVAMILGVIFAVVLGTTMGLANQ